MSDDLLKTGNIIKKCHKSYNSRKWYSICKFKLHNNKSLANEMVNAINKAVIDGKFQANKIESSYLRIKKLKEKLR